jgi:hypothetical protein
MNNIRQQILGGERPERRSLLGKKRKKGADGDAGLASVAISREAHRTTSSRDGDRHRLPHHEVRVVHKRKSYSVQLVNLSGGGAMISGDLHPMLWDRVDLHLAEGGKIECVVRWIKADRIGLEFEHETRLDCDDEARAKLLRAVMEQNFGDVEIKKRKRRKTDQAEETKITVEASSGDDKRGGRRHPLIWSGSLHYDFETLPIRVRNISEAGAMIECQAAIPVGAEPLVDLGDAGTIFATVTWAVGDEVGLKFHEPFDLNQLAKSKPEVITANWQRPGFVKPASAWDSPKAEDWDRMSLEELQESLEGFLKY